jgi:hypothetical protein
MRIRFYLSVGQVQDHDDLSVRCSDVSFLTQLGPDTPDTFLWKWTANQRYSAASAYRAFFHG